MYTIDTHPLTCYWKHNPCWTISGHMNGLTYLLDPGTLTCWSQDLVSYMYWTIVPAWRTFHIHHWNKLIVKLILVVKVIHGQTNTDLKVNLHNTTWWRILLHWRTNLGELFCIRESCYQLIHHSKEEHFPHFKQLKVSLMCSETQEHSLFHLCTLCMDNWLHLG